MGKRKQHRSRRWGEGQITPILFDKTSGNHITFYVYKIIDMILIIINVYYNNKYLPYIYIYVEDYILVRLAVLPIRPKD